MMKNNLLIKGIFALIALASSAFAEVSYVRDLALPDFGVASTLSTAQSPINGGGYRLPYVTSDSEYAALDLSTGTFDVQAAYTDIVVTPSSVFTWVGESATGAYWILITNRLITVFSIDDTVSLSTSRLKDNDGVAVIYTDAHSIAAQSLGAVSLLADTTHYIIDPGTGVATERPLSGVDTATTRFMAYGADGLLYVLDYGNDRIASFDPSNNFAFLPLKSFSLEDDVTVANEQFAIGINGSFYLSDGTGGGSYYNSLGQYQGVFSTGLVPDPLNGYNGQSYINTDASGAIIVYDAETGIHQYQDTSVVPEPGTVALIGLAGLALLFRRRVIRPARG